MANLRHRAEQTKAPELPGMPSQKSAGVVVVGADHNGFHLKEILEKHLQGLGYEVHDKGSKRLKPDDDFPLLASKVVHDMIEHGDESRGILICGSGQGMAIAANRYKGMRAVVLQDKEQARLARNDDDANILALPAFELEDDPVKVYDIVETWLNTPFERAPRRLRRLRQLDELS